jgi:hypothetical protein
MKPNRYFSISHLVVRAGLGTLLFTCFNNALQADIRIVSNPYAIRDDSVRIDLDIHVSDIELATERSLSLIPELVYEEKRVSLPFILLQGSRRARFDHREALISPERFQGEPYHTWVGIRKDRVYTLRYQVSLPYASWMQHASLRLRQEGKDCCNVSLLDSSVLTQDIDLPSPCPVVAVLPEEKPEQPVEAPVIEPSPMDKPSVSDSRTVKYEEYDVDLRQYRTKITAYIDYPRGSSAIDTRFGHNEEELDKVEAFFSPLLSNPNVLFKEIRITGYASPEGDYYSNETLSKARAYSFRAYLEKRYGLEAYPFRIAWVAEDWEGLRRILPGKPYAGEVEAIIRRYGIFQNRERHLMELDGGFPYRDMLRTLYPQLRRIEINVIYELHVTKEAY